MKSPSPALVSVLFCAGALPLVACTTFSGIPDLGESTGAGGTGGAGAGVGAVAANAASSSSGPPPPMMVAAQGVTLSEIAVYQGVKRSLMTGGSPGTGVPVVESRDALVRLFVTTDASYNNTPVTARLFLGEGSMPIETIATLGAPPTDDALSSTINFDVPGTALVKNMNFRVELLQPSTQSPGGNAAASYPATGFTSMDVRSVGAQLRITLVPIAYNSDGSGRLPDTSPTQLQAYKDEFFKMYPIPKLDLVVHAPMPWNSPVSPNGGGWSTLLDAVAQLRVQDGAPPDVYYYGAFSPASSVGAYCGGGCVAGLGMIGSPADSFSRASIGLGFTGKIAMDTVIHEVGHNHGRRHAPCGGAQGTDPSFPYPNAGLGVWGYNLLTKQLVPPASAKDLMGYCQPYWISDYNYNALFNEIKAVNGAKIVYASEELDRVYERVRIEPDGQLTWLDPVKLHTPPLGTPRELVVEQAAGPQKVPGHYFAYDHIEGGVLLWPQAKAAIKGIALEAFGQTVTLRR